MAHQRLGHREGHVPGSCVTGGAELDAHHAVGDRSPVGHRGRHHTDATAEGAGALEAGRAVPGHAGRRHRGALLDVRREGRRACPSPVAVAVTTTTGTCSTGPGTSTCQVRPAASQVIGVSTPSMVAVMPTTSGPRRAAASDTLRAPGAHAEHRPRQRGGVGLGLDALRAHRHDRGRQVGVAASPRPSRRPMPALTVGPGGAPPVAGSTQVTKPVPVASCSFPERTTSCWSGEAPRTVTARTSGDG